MHIIGQKTFVIETRAPKPGTFSNKLQDSDEGPVVVPDVEPEYEYLWFMGVGLHPDALLKGIAQPMNMWTPYPEQATRYKDIDEAAAVNEMILGKTAGGNVIDWDLCHKAEGRQIIVPVGDIEISKSNTGIDGKGRL